MNNNRTVLVNFRLNQDEFELLSNLCDSLDISRSAYIRSAIRDKIFYKGGE